MSFGPASGYCNRPSQVVFSDIPSDRLRCPRLQLRGSAGFAPASHKPACRRPTIMREPNFEKEQKQQPGKFTGHCDTKSNRISVMTVERRASRVCVASSIDPLWQEGRRADGVALDWSLVGRSYRVWRRRWKRVRL